MSWASENKFLTGFGVVLLGGVGTLGYLTYSAMGKYETAYGEYETAAGELRRFQEMKPYPDDANLKATNAQKEELNGKLIALQKDLKARALTIDPITKEKFQDKLKETVANVARKAGEAKVTFPDNFYMGCGEYQAKPPEDAAAPVLARQLRAIELVVQVLLNAGGIEVKELKRDPLPEERGVARAAAPKPAAARPRPGQASGRDKPEVKLVEKTGFKIAFSSSDSTFLQVLNNIVGHKEQLFVMRRIEIKNSVPEPPAKLADAGPPPAAPAAAEAPVAPAPGAAPAPAATPADPAAPPAPAAPPPPADNPAPAAPPAKLQGTLEAKFGTEKIEAVLEIEILDFAEPEAPQEKGGSRRPK